MSKYWETETPAVVDTGKNILRYFEQAGKVQISMPNWKNADGENKPGKTVTVDIAALVNDDVEIRRQAADLFFHIYNIIQGEQGEETF